MRSKCENWVTWMLCKGHQWKIKPSALCVCLKEVAFPFYFSRPQRSCLQLYQEFSHSCIKNVVTHSLPHKRITQSSFLLKCVSSLWLFILNAGTVGQCTRACGHCWNKKSSLLSILLFHVTEG